MSEKKSYKITIFGDQYSLISDESENHVMQSAQMVDSFMREIVTLLPNTQSHDASAKQAAVLAALRIASILLRVQELSDDQKRKQHDLVALLERTLANTSSSSSLQ